MKRKVFWMLLSFLLVAALVLASCGKAAPGEQEEEEEEEEEEEVGGPQYGGTLTVSTMSLDMPPEAWDPTQGGFSGTDLFVGPYLEELFVGDVTQGATGTGEHRYGTRFIPMDVLKGELALSWEMGIDPYSVVFHLKPGIYWRDSPIMERRELTAEDVVYTLTRRRADPMWGEVARPANWEWIDDFIVTDKYTVTVTLNAFYADWMFQLGWGMNTTIIPPELVAAGVDNWRNHVGIGTGPFLLKEYVTGSHVIYERNPDHRGTTIIDGKEYPIPFVDEYIYTIMPDRAMRLATLRTGALDIWEVVPWTYGETLASTNPELAVWEAEGHDHYYIGMRLDIEPFDNKMVRQAMSMAVDRDIIVDQLMGGYGLKYNWPLPIGSGPSIHTLLKDQPLAVQRMYEYHPEDAKQMLTDAGYPNGFKAELILRTDPLTIDIVSLVADFWWENLNIEVDIVPMASPAWVGVMLNIEQKGMAGVWESGPTPTFSLADYAYGRVAMMRGKPEADPYRDYFLEQYRLVGATEDPAERYAIVKETTDYMVSEMIYVFLPTQNHLRYAWPWVRNYEGEVLSSYGESIDLYSIIWIDRAMKADMGY